MNKDDDNDSLARLMQLAGERPGISLNIESRVRHRVEDEWRRSTSEHSGDEIYEKVHKTWRRTSLRSAILRWVLPVGVAATAIIAAFIMSPTEVPTVQIAATVSRVVGDGALTSIYSKGSEVPAGATIRTGPDEGLSLLLARSESLRVDANTEIRVDAADRFTLLAGRVYADTGQFIYRNGGMRIETSFGTVTDVGTQFSVAAAEQSLEVAVREGRVDVRNDTNEYAARVGERLILDAGMPASISSLDVHDEYWDWVADLAPSFDLNNRSLLDFLKWAARETGRELEFESDETRMTAMRTDPRGGPLDGLTPDEALVAVLATTSLRYQILDDKIIIAN